RVADEQNALTAERASEAIERWRTTAQQLASDPQGDDSAPRKTYAKMAAEQAALLLSHQFTAEAEQAFRIANDICPSSPEPLFRYANLLVEQKRYEEAARLAENAARSAPDNTQFRDLAEQLRRLAKN